MHIRPLIVLPLALMLSAISGVAQLRQIAMIDIPGRPGFDGLGFVNGYLVMSHAGADSLDVFDLPRRRLVTQVTGMKGPTGIAVDQRGAKIYVANSDGNNIALVSTRTWQVLETIPVENSPQALLLTPDGQRLYVADWQDGAISSVDLAQGNRVSTARVGGSPEYLAYDPQRKLLFATLQDQHQIVALDAALQVVKRYQLTASQPTGLAFDAKARRLYVAVRYAVLALDEDTGAEAGRVATPAGTDMLWFDAPSSTLYAAAVGSIAMITAGPGKLEKVGELQTEVRGHVLAFDPTTNIIYMPGGREGRSKLLILKRVPAASSQTQQMAEKGAANSTPRQ